MESPVVSKTGLLGHRDSVILFVETSLCLIYGVAQVDNTGAAKEKLYSTPEDWVDAAGRDFLGILLTAGVAQRAQGYRYTSRRMCGQSTQV